MRLHHRQDRKQKQPESRHRQSWPINSPDTRGWWRKARKAIVRGFSAALMLSSKRKSSQAVLAEGSFKKGENNKLPDLLTDLQRSGLEAWSDNRFRPSKIILTAVFDIWRIQEPAKMKWAGYKNVCHSLVPQNDKHQGGSPPLLELTGPRLQTRRNRD